MKTKDLLLHHFLDVGCPYNLTEVSLNQNFDELFIAAEKQPAQAFIHLSLAGNICTWGPY